MYDFLRSSLRAAGLLAAGAGMEAASEKSGYSLFRSTPTAQLREMSTDRPDQTESPYTVDAGRWQLEMDLLNYTYDRDTSGGGDVRTRALSVAPINLKVGLRANMDLQLMADPYVRSTAEDRAVPDSTTTAGFGDITTRLKVNFWGNDGGPTAFAVMSFVKWPLSASAVRNGKTEGGIIFILGYELPAGWDSAMMTEIDFVSDGAGGRSKVWINSITFAHDLADRLGCYVELFTVTRTASGHRWQAQLDIGLTYALSGTCQLDLGCNFGVTATAPDYQPFVGISHRF